MTYRLKFGNLELDLIQEWSPGVEPLNKTYILYDGNTVIATSDKIKRRPSASGLCTESDITTLTGEIGKKQTLNIKTGTGDWYFHNTAIINVSINYYKYANNTNYYKVRLEFATEGGT